MPCGRRGRRQVPGGAVEEVLARVLDARRLRSPPAGGRRRSARRASASTTARLVEPTSVTTQRCAAPARGPRPRCRPARRPGRRRTRRRRRRARRRGRGGRSSIAPRGDGLVGARVEPAHRRAEPASGRPVRPTRRSAPTPTTATIKRAATKAALPATAAAASHACARTRRSPRCAAPAGRRRWPPRARGAPRR